MSADNAPLDTALLAAREGLSVVPPKEDGTKTPLDFWKKYQSTPADETQIRKWYQNGRSGVGLVCGQVSGGLEMFEFEGRAVRDGIHDRFKQLAEEAGLGDVLTRIRNGYVEETPGGGIHVLWRCAEVEGNQRLARRVNEDGEIKPLIETRGEGGFTIIAPSAGSVHETGKPYVMVRGGLDSIPTITPAERRDLLNIARTLDEMPEEPKDLYNWKQSTGKDGRPGDNYNDRTTGADVVALLERHEWVSVYRLGDRTLMRRPGKNIGVSATVFDSGAFVCFTTSTRFDGYDQTKKTGVYSPFSVYAILEHNGDYSAAARALIPTVNMKGKKPAPADLNLPADFWSERPRLTQIRDASWNRICSPDAVLHAVLVRVIANSSHTFRLPPIIGGLASLSIYIALVGPPGGGKTSSWRAAGEMIRTEATTVTGSLGSGEGLVEAYFEMVEEPSPTDPKKTIKVKRQTKHNLMVYADEGESLHQLSTRSGSTLLSTLRNMFTGGQVGNLNASQERIRNLEPDSYVIGFAMGIQEGKVGPLLADADGGTPQRFLFAMATDPNIPEVAPAWPAWEWHPPHPVTQLRGIRSVCIVDAPAHIQAVIADEQRVKQRGIEAVDELEAHGNLVRLKVAAALALLEGRTKITDDDWRLAGVIGETSARVRRHLQQVVAEQAERADKASAKRQARRQIEVSEATAGHEVVKAAIRIANVVRTDPGITWSDVRRGLTKTQRQWAVEALEHAVGENWVTEQEEPGSNAGPKRTLKTGSTRAPK